MPTQRFERCLFGVRRESAACSFEPLTGPHSDRCVWSHVNATNPSPPVGAKWQIIEGRISSWPVDVLPCAPEFGLLVHDYIAAAGIWHRWTSERRAIALATGRECDTTCERPTETPYTIGPRYSSRPGHSVRSSHARRMPAAASAMYSSTINRPSTQSRSRHPEILWNTSSHCSVAVRQMVLISIASMRVHSRPRRSTRNGQPQLPLLATAADLLSRV